MEILVVAILALLLISLALAAPRSMGQQDAFRHRQTLAEMQQITDDAKDHITHVHRAYRAELARTAKAHADKRRIP